MSKYDEFDLDIKQDVENTHNESTIASSNPCWAVTTYISSSLLNGNCKTVNSCISTDGSCPCDRSVSTPCTSGMYKVK